ncbi:MAG TPA: ribose 5-phosphate isomerase B [Symbiobacteriaceae bacterium]|jgi:ribose 5-phosphate isomerase B
MKVAIGCDHGGLDLKEAVISVLKDLALEVVDMGTSARTSCDYPDFAEKVSAAVAAHECEQGILICGTGIGMSMSANKVRGIRAALCNEVYSARMARQHNDANILCMGARVVGAGVAEEIVRAYFAHSFEGDRHARRVAKIMALEERKQG